MEHGGKVSCIGLNYDLCFGRALGRATGSSAARRRRCLGRALGFGAGSCGRFCLGRLFGLAFGCGAGAPSSLGLFPTCLRCWRGAGPFFSSMFFHPRALSRSLPTFFEHPTRFFLYRLILNRCSKVGIWLPAVIHSERNRRTSASTRPSRICFTCATVWVAVSTKRVKYDAFFPNFTLITYLSVC